MKKYLSFILALVMMATYMVIPTMAVSPVDVEKEVQKINDVYIPTTAERVQEGTATVYYNFYDSVNDMHYAFIIAKQESILQCLDHVMKLLPLQMHEREKL